MPKRKRKSSNPGIRWDLVRKARQKLQAGEYDDVSDWMTPATQFRLSRDLDVLDLLGSIPPGDGDAYRELVAGILVRALAPVIDHVLIQREFPVRGGRGDLDFPVRTEVANKFPLLDHWCRRYDLRRLVIETKNVGSRSDVSHVVQTEGYLCPSTGRLGILVTRLGFTKAAMRRMESIAQAGERLVLPMCDNDLNGLWRAHRSGMDSMMEFMRRRETLLLQGAA